MFELIKPFVPAVAASALVAVLAAVFPAPVRWARRIIFYRWLRFARHGWSAAAALILTILAIRLALLPWLPLPRPGAHDEFSYLLGADTFASGRWTNPPHRYWESFESFHILQQPTYASMYPPGPAFVYSLGIRIAGTPWAGVLLATLAMLAAVYWFLRAIFTRNWALFGVFLIGVERGLTHYWSNSYFGGSLAAFGGALIAGTLMRFADAVTRAAQARLLAIAAVGTVCAISARPSEGLLISLPVWIYLFVRLLRQQRGSWAGFAIAIVPAVLICSAYLSVQLYYNYRVTGDPLTLPYLVQRRTYAVAPTFLFESRRSAPTYRHPEMKDFYLKWEEEYQGSGEFASPKGWILGVLNHLHTVLKFGPVHLLLCLPALWWLRSHRVIRLMAIPAIGLALIVTLQRYVQAHYIAPIYAILIAAGLQCLQRLRRWRLGRRFQLGTALAAGAIIGVLATAVYYGRVYRQTYTTGFHHDRQQIIDTLLSKGPSHLVFVKYPPNFYIHSEWVYNDADIDGSEIVWARFTHEQRRQDLVRYFPRRQAWVLSPETLTLTSLSDGSVLRATQNPVR